MNPRVVEEVESYGLLQSSTIFKEIVQIERKYLFLIEINFSSRLLNEFFEKLTPESFE